MSYKITLKSKDEIKMLIEILESDKERLEEVLAYPEHYKNDFPYWEKCKRDLPRVQRLLKDLKSFYEK